MKTNKNRFFKLLILLAKCRFCGLVMVNEGSSFRHPRVGKCASYGQVYQLPGPVYVYPVKGKP